MTAIDLMHRAWIVFDVGVVFLALAALQLWGGRAFVGFGWRTSPWAFRKKEPLLFWGNVAPLAAIGFCGIGFGLSRLL